MPHADQQLLVVWGKGQDTKHCNDVWILNTVTMQWKEASYMLTCTTFESPIEDAPHKGNRGDNLRTNQITKDQNIYVNDT